jgi:hypothetical protein
VEGLKSGTAFEAIRAIASSTSAAYSRQSSHVVDPCGTLRTPSERRNVSVLHRCQGLTSE